MKTSIKVVFSLAIFVCLLTQGVSTYPFESSVNSVIRGVEKMFGIDPKKVDVKVQNKGIKKPVAPPINNAKTNPEESNKIVSQDMKKIINKEYKTGEKEVSSFIKSFNNVNNNSKIVDKGVHRNLEKLIQEELKNRRDEVTSLKNKIKDLSNTIKTEQNKKNEHERPNIDFNKLFPFDKHFMKHFSKKMMWIVKFMPFIIMSILAVSCILGCFCCFTCGICFSRNNQNYERERLNVESQPVEYDPYGDVELATRKPSPDNRDQFYEMQAHSNRNVASSYNKQYNPFEEEDFVKI